VGETAAVAFNVELIADTFDVITLEEAAAVELVGVKDPLADVDKDSLEVASLAVIEVSARI
jgi:hypothetical protein